MQQEPLLMPFQDQPFNGDTYICEKFLELKEQYDIKTVIETGTCFGVTTKWLAENFEFVFTVEINEEFANFARKRLAGMGNVISIVHDSVLMLKHVNNLINPERQQTRFIFFLDAHWGEHCPLLDEIEAISRIGLKQAPVIAIHDFYTGSEQLGYDSYNGQPFTYDFIKPAVEQVEKVYGIQYVAEYNTIEKSAGAKRGIIYLHPLEPKPFIEDAEIITD